MYWNISKETVKVEKIVILETSNSDHIRIKFSCLRGGIIMKKKKSKREKLTL